MVLAPNGLGRLERAAVDGATLGGIFELACTYVAWRQTHPAAARLAEKWAAPSEIASETLARLAGAHPRPSTERIGVEIAPIECAEDLIGSHGTALQQRFKHMLTTNGFPLPLAQALTGAFAEMADNIVQHSGNEEGKPAPGIWGYHVEQQWVSFAVADIGRGVLKSLRTNSRHAHVQDGASALEAAVTNGATRRTNQASGGGFSTLHRALANLNGILRFRSDTACLVLDGCSNERKATTTNSSDLHGLQLSVICALRPPFGARKL